METSEIQTRLEKAHDERYGSMSEEQRREAEVESRDRLAKMEETIHTRRPKQTPPVECLNADLRKLLEWAKLNGLSGKEIDHKACFTIAFHLGELYGWPNNRLAVQRVWNSAAKHGLSATIEAAKEMLREGYDPDVKNPWSVLSKRAADIRHLEIQHKADRAEPNGSGVEPWSTDNGPDASGRVSILVCPDAHPEVN